jgi:hypothetical protein
MWKHKNVTRVVLLVFSVLLVSLLFSHKTDATAGINQEMAFEGKIVLTNGTNITNGTYNMEFKIYSGGTSTGGGTLDWTEDYLVGGSGGVTMNNGTFEINLGSVNPFGASVNWNSYPLYLSLQVGNSSACTITTTFQSNCGGDGEMSPYINLTAVPYAFDALELGGVQASGFGQLANAQTWAGVQTLTSNLIANGGAAITGVTTEAYTTGVSGSAQTATVSDTNTTATAATVNGLTLSLAGTANSSGTNTNDGIYFTSIAGAPITGNTFNGLSFGTGYTNLITSANFTVAASGAVTGGAYDGLTLSSSSLAFSGASANTITGTSGQNLTLASAGAGELLLGSGSGTIGLTSTTTTLQSTATGTTNIDLDNAATTTLQVENSGSGVANLNLYGGSLETGTTPVIRLTNAGALTNITTIGASGAVTAGAYNGVTLSSSSLAFSGASANTITGTSGQNLTLASAGAGELLLGSGSGTIGLGSSTSTIQNIASGTTNIDLDDTSNTTLQLENSGSGVADLNLYGGSLETGSTPVIRLTNAGALTNITTIGASGLATLSGGILVGSASVTNNTQDLLQLNSYDTLADTSTCSTSSNQGALYYNVVSNEVRGCINGTWQDLVSTASLALQLFGVVPNSGNNPGDLVGASATNTAGTGGPCKVNWASTTSVTVSPCLAYSDGREVSVPQTTIALTITANDYVNICLNASGTPTLMGGSATPDGTQTAANLVNTNATTLSDPILCLATIKATGTANNISVIYDTRTFTTTQKTYGTMASATEVLGGLVGPAAGGEVVATTATTGAVLGVVVATTNTAGTAGKPNIIYATQGPEWIKATGGTVNDIMNPTATSSYASGAATTGLDAYDDVGLDMSTFETSCAAATYGVTDCQASDFTNLNIH